MDHLKPVETASLDLPGLSADELARVARPLAEAWTLPPAAYTSEVLWEIEKKEVLQKSWIPLGRVDQIAKPGDYIAMTLLDQPLMMVHGHDGEIRVMSRVCRHRAAPVVEGAGNKKLFTCPYHAWSYGTDGNLVRAPHMEEAEGFDEKSCRLHQLSTEVWMGFILVNLDPDAAPLAPQLEGYTKYFENYKLDEVTLVDTIEFDSHWNWKVLVENFMEAYHHIATHSTTFEPTYHAVDAFVPPSDGPWSILHMPTTQEHTSAHGLPLMEGLEDWQTRDLLATVIYPFFLLGIQGDTVVWYQILPLSESQLTLKIHTCVPKISRDLPDLGEKLEILRQGISYIHGEDIAANDLVWQGLNAPLTQQGRLSKMERSIWHLNQWWLGMMGGHNS